MSRTFYEVLELSPEATQEEITAAYREKVKEYHPDVSDREDTADEFRKVVRAEEVLGDEDERAAYDRLGHEAYVRRVDAQNAATGEHSPWTTSERGDRGTSGDRRSEETASAGESTGGSDASQARSDGFGRADSSHGFGSAADRQHGASATGESESRWSSRAYTAGGTGETTGGSTYSVHDWDDEEMEPDTVTIEVTQEVAVLAATVFLIYPLLVYASITPDFPLVANLAVGACTLLVIGYMLTIPKIAVGVFGAWSFAAPIALLTVLDWGTNLSLFALGVCWIPFAYAVGVSYVVRPQ